MKNALIKFLLVASFFLGAHAVALSQVKDRAARKGVEPTAKEAIKQILSNGDVLLSAGKNCQSVGTSKTDKNIFDFLSGILSFQVEPQTDSEIVFTFKKNKNRKNEIVWSCDVLFTGKTAEDVWSNGIRFDLRDSDRKLLRNSIMCIGTG